MTVKPWTLHLALFHVIEPLHSWGLWLKGRMTRVGSVSFPATQSKNRFFWDWGLGIKGQPLEVTSLPLPLSTFLVLLPPDCKFNCHKRCATRVPNDCLGEALINGGKKLGVLSGKRRQEWVEAPLIPLSPQMCPWRRPLISARLTRAPSRMSQMTLVSSLAPTRKMLSMPARRRKERGANLRGTQGPIQRRLLPHPYCGLISPCTFTFPSFLRPVAEVASNLEWLKQGEWGGKDGKWGWGVWGAGIQITVVTPSFLLVPPALAAWNLRIPFSQVFPGLS